jgi:hypothetical protein
MWLSKSARSKPVIDQSLFIRRTNIDNCCSLTVNEKHTKIRGCEGKRNHEIKGIIMNNVKSSRDLCCPISGTIQLGHN